MKRRILVVDNMPAMAAPVRAFLERQGYEVPTASSIAQAMEIAKQSPPDVVVLDLRLTDDSSYLDFSGLELARQLDPQIPKVLLTAYPTVQAVRQALGPAADGLPPAVAFLSKREPLAVLLETVQHMLNLRSETSAGEPSVSIKTEEIDLLRELRQSDLEPEAAIAKISKFIAERQARIADDSNLHINKIERYHRISIAAFILGIVSVVCGIFAILWGRLQIAVPLFGLSLVGHIIGTLFTRWAAKEHRNIEIFYKEKNELMKFEGLLALCSRFEDPEQRDQNRQIVFDAFLSRLDLLLRPQSQQNSRQAKG